MGGYLLLTLGALAGSFAVSYVKARAESFIADCGVGLFERAVRLLILFLGTIIPGLLGPALWLLFLGSNGTALYRLFYTRKQLSQPSK